MKTKTLLALFVTSSVLATTGAYADHNSVWGPGTANMPNDIHNTRIDTMQTDNDEFRDFVRYGEGADSENRFLEDDEALNPNYRRNTDQSGNRNVSRNQTSPSRSMGGSMSGSRSAMSRGGGRR